MSAVKFNTVEEYIKSFSGIQKKQLLEMRKIVKKAAPKSATEVISYNMPAIRLNEVLVYYAANKNHIGFYPTGSPIKKFQLELTPYKWSKGAVQFLLDEPLPAVLIKKMVALRIIESEERQKMKKK